MKLFVTILSLSVLTGCASNYDAYKNHSYYKTAHPDQYQQSQQSGQAAQPARYTPPVESKPDEPLCGETCKLVVGLAVTGVVVHYIAKTAVVAKQHPCVLPTDRAKNGSICGGRASTIRPGGN